MTRIAEIYREHPLLWAWIVGSAGLAAGSFLQLAAVRIPAGLSVIEPPSRCDSCGHRLGFFDLVPVLNYFFLRGRCRHCRHPFSPLHPFAEAVCGVSFFLLALRFGFHAELAVALLLFCILFVAAWTDLTHRIIPDKVILFGMIVAIPLRIWTHPEPLWSYAVAFVSGSGVLVFIDACTRKVFGKEGVGGGDIKLFAWLGLVLGWELTLAALLISSLLGLVGGSIVLSLSPDKEHHRYIPFGPYIAVSALAAYLWGEQALEIYKQWIIQIAQ